MQGPFSGPESEGDTERKAGEKAGNSPEKGGCPAKGSWVGGARRSWYPSGFGSTDTWDTGLSLPFQ